MAAPDALPQHPVNRLLHSLPDIWRRFLPGVFPIRENSLMFRAVEADLT
jgi:hypothetical protein